MNVVITRDVEADKQGDMTYVLEFTTEDGSTQSFETLHYETTPLSLKSADAAAGATPIAFAAPEQKKSAHNEKNGRFIDPAVFLFYQIQPFMGTKPTRSFTTSPPMMRPTTDGTKAFEPGTERRMVHLRWVPGGQMQWCLQLMESSSMGVMTGSLE